MDVVIFVNGLFFRFSTYHIAIVLPIYIEIFLKNLRFLSLTVIWIRIIFIKWTNHVPYFFEILGNNLNCREGVMQIKIREKNIRKLSKINRATSTFEMQTIFPPFFSHISSFISVWPEENHQMSIKVAQKWFH